jgi:hypothetical protein
MDTTISTISQSVAASAARARATRERLGMLRRLAMVLFGAWILGVTALATYELVTHQVGYFVALSLPVGTKVAGDQATLPDGRVVTLERTVDVKSLEPGQIDWSEVPGVVSLQARASLIGIVLLIPLATWAVVECLILLVGWILRDLEVGKR